MISIVSPVVFADGIVIDKIYHPYVQPLEQELEWRVSAQNSKRGYADNTQLHRFAYGRSINDRWFLEAYIVAKKSDQESFTAEGLELESLWQITEQGEYWADLGVVFEFEKEAHKDIWEFSGTILSEKEWGKWSGTANISLGKEWGDDIKDEWETNLNLQARYRLSRHFEPAIEYYSGEGTKAVGPAALGNIRLGGDTPRTLKWEIGLIFGLDNESPDKTLRALIEFEY